MVLYVEDRAADIAFMKDFLSSVGNVSLVVATSGELALDLVPGLHPAVVLLDVELGGGMDGFEVFSRLRAREETASVPVIALTALATARDRARARHLGILRYLVKPLKVEELVKAISLVVPITVD